MAKWFLMKFSKLFSVEKNNVLKKWWRNWLSTMKNNLYLFVSCQFDTNWSHLEGGNLNWAVSACGLEHGDICRILPLFILMIIGVRGPSLLLAVPHLGRWYWTVEEHKLSKPWKQGRKQLSSTITASVPTFKCLLMRQINHFSPSCFWSCVLLQQMKQN